jgi:hypothetical protein
VLELDDDQQDLVTPIVNLMAEGKYDEAREAVNKIPTTWRIAVIWTVAAQTGIVL